MSRGRAGRPHLSLEMHACPIGGTERPARRHWLADRTPSGHHSDCEHSELPPRDALPLPSPAVVSVAEDMQRQAINSGRECYSSSWLVALATEDVMLWTTDRCIYHCRLSRPPACVEPLIMIHVAQHMKLPAGGSAANRATRPPTGDWETGRSQLWQHEY